MKVTARPGPFWLQQFAEDNDERDERWRRLKAKRKAEGKCWQCARLAADCDCPNVSHKPAPPA